MGDAPVLTTPRLLLRPWRPGDREPFAALNADPETMRHFPATLTRTQSDALADRIQDGFRRHGFGLWAVEVTATGTFIGFTGLSVPAFPAHFQPSVEIGWRLARHAWGHGYATEAARRALAHGFQDEGLQEIVSFTATANDRSRAVMHRIGMTHDPADDFDHPNLPAGHPLHRHVLYRLDAHRWRALTTPPARDGAGSQP
ncbi:GNAT family N-acetyltransferase [Actinomadura viridis]|uniref:Ribosomal-protein-alanine N-acetyltransferase n=1 Tax=Actinomadura viridis TaxID=58110 RepID=A0A931GNP6_9ACTN|nr:GNAT family N-acetyltransferase [Actinomadura viridis]MBG6089751.1 ribosomal-protein-alanine N-acetyltransferase [Actinomadura viridis]